MSGEGRGGLFIEIALARSQLMADKAIQSKDSSDFCSGWCATFSSLNAVILFL